MKKIYFIAYLLVSINSFGQSSYSGFIDKFPIEFCSDANFDGPVLGFYVYEKYDEPIKFSGTLKNGLLILHEKDSLGKNTAMLIFKNFQAKSNKTEGTWKNLRNNKELKITLTKKFANDYNESREWKNVELLQANSFKNIYFKLLINKTKEDFTPKVTGLKLYEKKTDRLVQQFNDLDCQLMGLESLEINDYNFDGLLDFSIFEQSYAGANTSRVYFLFNPEIGNYDKSSFTGTSLEFNPKTKRIIENNQCCGGRNQTISEYKVVNNEMILIIKNCYELIEKTGKLRKVKCED